jgi:hypothetical protein
MSLIANAYRSCGILAVQRSDLQYIEGKHDELFGRIQKRTGETREVIEKAVKETCSSCCCG